jgi:hypothetical protein
MMACRYALARQFSRHHREPRFLCTRLGRLIRNIRCAPAGQFMLHTTALPGNPCTRQASRQR